MKFYIIRPLLILTVSIFISESCSFKNKETDFEKFYMNIPIMNLPIIFKSGHIYQNSDERIRNDILIDTRLQKVDSNYKDKFFPSSVFNRLVGRIFVHKDFISIIYSCDADNSWPFLFTYSKQGDKIDSLSLNCAIGLDFQGYETSISIIEDDKNIILTDTAYYYNCDSTGFKSTIDYKIIKNEKYLLKDDGRFYQIFAKRDSVK